MNFKQQLQYIIRDLVNVSEQSFTGSVSDNSEVYSFSFPDTWQSIKIIEKGITLKVFQEIQQVVPLNQGEWADILGLSEKSLERYEKDINFSFKPIHSERILGVLEVIVEGYKVFESKNDLYKWLHSSILSLQNRRPIDLLRDSYGRSMVLETLNRIEHGIIA